MAAHGRTAVQRSDAPHAATPRPLAASKGHDDAAAAAQRLDARNPRRLPLSRAHSIIDRYIVNINAVNRAPLDRFAIGPASPVNLNGGDPPRVAGTDPMAAFEGGADKICSL